MSKTNAPAVATLDADVAALVNAQASVLATADASFESAMTEVATAVARIMGTKPTFAHWELVRDEFATDYAKARNCKDETARKRWLAVANVMAEEFALEKPTKPTEAAKAKADQRKDADVKAAELVKTQKATSAQGIMEIAAKTPGLAKGVVAALGKLAQAKAQESQKDASTAAREAAKALREELRKDVAKLGLEQLREVSAYINARQQAGWPTIETEKPEDLAKQD